MVGCWLVVVVVVLSVVKLGSELVVKSDLPARSGIELPSRKLVPESRIRNQSTIMDLRDVMW